MSDLAEKIFVSMFANQAITGKETFPDMAEGAIAAAKVFEAVVTKHVHAAELEQFKALMRQEADVAKYMGIAYKGTIIDNVLRNANSKDLYDILCQRLGKKTMGEHVFAAMIND